jgi:tRNA G18 (ribose-2'-O)-methylase SpoU
MPSSSALSGRHGVEHIDRAGDPRVAGYRGLRDGELLRARGLFVAEGRQIVRRVVEDARYRVQSVLLNAAALRDLEPVIAGCGRDVPILLGGAKELADIAGYEVHRGCLALVHRPPETAMDELLAPMRMLVILEAVANPDNVGGVFRNAAAFGAGGVLLSPTCCDPLYRKAIRTSMGATLQVPYARAVAGDWPRVLTDVKAAGFTIVALTLRQPSETFEEFQARPRAASSIAVVLGTSASLPAVELAPLLRADSDQRRRWLNVRSPPASPSTL